MRRFRWRSQLVAALAMMSIVVIGCQKDQNSTQNQSNNNPPPGQTRKMHVGIVHIVQGQKHPTPSKQHVSYSDSLLDHVRWINEAAVQETITFTGKWPFMEKAEAIVIDPGKMSAWYTMSPTAGAAGEDYEYHVGPPTRTGPGGGPGEPAITGDP